MKAGRFSSLSGKARYHLKQTGFWYSRDKNLHVKASCWDDFENKYLQCLLCDQKYPKNTLETKNKPFECNWWIECCNMLHILFRAVCFDIHFRTVCWLVFEKNYYWYLEKCDTVMEKVVDNEELIDCIKGDPFIYVRNSKNFFYFFYEFFFLF